MRNENTENGEQWDLTKHHPDHKWLKQFNRWELTVNLTYRYNQGWKKDIKTLRREINQFFGELAHELTGIPRPELLSWYVRFQIDDNDRFHAHGVLGSNGAVKLLDGRERKFTGYPELMAFMGSQWTHGSSLFQPIHNQAGWINYITRPNSVQETWASPVLKSLKNQCLERKINEIVSR